MGLGVPSIVDHWKIGQRKEVFFPDECYLCLKRRSKLLITRFMNEEANKTVFSVQFFYNSAFVISQMPNGLGRLVEYTKNWLIYVNLTS